MNALITRDQLQKLGYDYLDNSEIEIFNAINEMHLHVVDKNSLKNSSLNEKFWSLYEKYYSKKRPKKTFISNNFLEKNSELLN